MISELWTVKLAPCRKNHTFIQNLPVESGSQLVLQLQDHGVLTANRDRGY
jgi:hypothetical protein